LAHAHHLDAAVEKRLGRFRAYTDAPLRIIPVALIPIHARLNEHDRTLRDRRTGSR
jgi:hypothetical protein